MTTVKPPNGERATPEARRAIAELEIEAERAAEASTKPCCARIGNQSWCGRPDGHDGDHDGPAPVYGPIEERPKLWRDTKGMGADVESVKSGMVGDRTVTIVKLRTK